MNKVTIAEVRNLIKLSAFDLTAIKRGSGVIHLESKNYNNLTGFANFAALNGVYVQVDAPKNWSEFQYAYVCGRLEKVSA